MKRHKDEKEEADHLTEEVVEEKIDLRIEDQILKIQEEKIENLRDLKKEVTEIEDLMI